MRTKCWRRWLFVLIAAVAVAPTAASPATAREYQLKAVFLFNFTQFVMWPAELFASAQTPIVIGVLGDDPYGSYLDDTVRGEKVDGRPLVVERYRRVEDATACQVLFIGRSEGQRIDQVVAQLKGRSILTVSDADRAKANGAGSIVRFVTENNHIRLQIDAAAAKAAHLTISSKLLRAAEIIGGNVD